MPRWSAIAASLALVAMACDEPAPRPAPTPAPEAPEPAAAETAPAPPEVEPACSVDAIEHALEGARGGTLALAVEGDHRFLAIADGDEARTVPLGADGAPGEAHAHPLPGALLALAPLGDDAIAITRAPCPEAARCLHARLASATAPEATVVAPLPGALVTTRRARTEGRLYLAWSAAGGERGLEVFVADGSLGRVRRALGPERADAELPAEILGLAADGERWAAVWRRGAGEDERSRVFLTTDTSHRAMEALHEALVVEAMTFDGRRAELVAGFEMSRPHALVLTPDADEPSSAHELEPGEVPDAFRDRVRGRLSVDDDGLHLERTSAAGDPIGERFRVAEGGVHVGALARDGERFLVAWLDREGTLHLAWVRCGGAGSE